MRILICDNDIKQVKELELFVNKWAANKGKINTVSFTNPVELIFSLPDMKPFDLALMDISMKQMDGIDLVKKIRQNGKSIQIVFITALTNRISEGYDVSALHYLIKPYKKEKLLEVLNNAFDIYSSKKDKALMVYFEREYKTIPHSEIIWCESMCHYIQVHTYAMGEIRIKKKMMDLAAELDKNFFVQCHRCCIINIMHVMKLTNQSVTMLKVNDKTKNPELPLSKTFKKNVTEAFINYHQK